jgi:GTP-binding protein EngB required for normal cell division
LLDNNQSQILAYQKICTIFSEQSLKIQPSSILALPVYYVEVESPDLEELIPSAKLITTSFNFGNIQSEFTIKIESPNKETSLKVEDSLSKIRLKYKFSISARKGKQNRVTFSLNQLKGSEFYTNLKGLGNIAYVHRDDLRKLTEVIRTQIKFEAVLEKPDVFDNILLEKLLERWKQTESSKLFDDTKWQSTYNQDDLKPDVITKEINKLVTKDDKHDLWKLNEASFDVSAEGQSANQSGGNVPQGGVSLLGMLTGALKAKLNAKGKLSTEDMKHLIQERNIEATIEGNRIEVKSINLHRINLSDFDDQTRLTSEVTFLDDSEMVLNTGFIEFSRLLAKDRVNQNRLNDVIALFGKINTGKSAIIKLLGSKLSCQIMEVPGFDFRRSQDYDDVVLKIAKQANIHIFVIDGEPYHDELVFFDLIHNQYSDIPKIVFVNKWDIITRSYPKKDQEVVCELISSKMSKFVQSQDILYGSAMFYDPEKDSMVYREIPELINQIKEMLEHE